VDGRIHQRKSSFSVPERAPFRGGSPRPKPLPQSSRNTPTAASHSEWAATALFAHPVPGPNAVPIGEWALRILDRGGITGDEAVATFSGIIALNYGWASFVVARTGGAGETLADDLRDPGLARAFPLTASVAGPMSRYGSGGHYGLVLGQLLAGLSSGA
jgi:hypothetical protein